jgi:hypothetical protein
MTTIREVQKAIDAALRSAGFYDREQVDGWRFQTIGPAIERAQTALGLKLTMLREADTYGCVLKAEGVAGTVCIRAHRKVPFGRDGSYVENPDFGATWSDAET